MPLLFTLSLKEPWQQRQQYEGLLGTENFHELCLLVRCKGDRALFSECDQKNICALSQ